MIAQQHHSAGLWLLAWRRLKADTTAMISLAVVAVFLLIISLSAAGFIHDSQVHHTWHTRLPYGYPIPSLRRDRALDVIHSTLELRDVYSRGRFGAWKYEVSNQDHSFMQGVELVDRLADGAEEVTLRHPALVNAGRR